MADYRRVAVLLDDAEYEALRVDAFEQDRSMSSLLKEAYLGIDRRLASYVRECLDRGESMSRQVLDRLVGGK